MYVTRISDIRVLVSFISLTTWQNGVERHVLSSIAHPRRLSFHECIFPSGLARSTREAHAAHILTSRDCNIFFDYIRAPLSPLNSCLIVSANPGQWYFTFRVRASYLTLNHEAAIFKMVSPEATSGQIGTCLCTCLD